MSTDTIEVAGVTIDVNYIQGRADEDVLNFEETDDEAHDRFTHIINPPSNVHIWRPGMSAQDVVDIARANGWPVKALCGKVWVPKHNPDKYPACPTCMDIAHKLISENE